MEYKLYVCESLGDNDEGLNMRTFLLKYKEKYYIDFYRICYWSFNWIEIERCFFDGFFKNLETVIIHIESYSDGDSSETYIYDRFIESLKELNKQH